MHSGLKTLSVTVQYYIHYRQTNKDGFTELSIYYLHVSTCIEIHTYVQIIKKYILYLPTFLLHLQIFVYYHLMWQVVLTCVRLLKENHDGRNLFKFGLRSPKAVFGEQKFFSKLFYLEMLEYIQRLLKLFLPYNDLVVFYA